MFVDFNILNQLGSPSINSNTFANRPAAGQTGRLFVSTDTFEIYRDNGTTWDLIGGPGSSTITGTGTATQVAYFTSSQAIGSSANLFWDNTSGFLGVGTATPSARIEAVKTDGVGIYSNFTTNAGSGSSTTALWAKNITNSSGFAAVIEETTPNTTAGQYPLLIKHSLSSGTAGVGMGTGLHFQLPDDAGTFKTTQLTVETIDAAAATYATRYRFNVQSNGTGTPVAYINSTGLGIFTATPGAALDIHSTGIMVQLNSTSATANSLLAFQRSGSGLWRIGDAYNGGNNYFELHNTVLTNNAVEINAATNKSIFTALETYTTGLARGNYFDYNLSVSAGGSFSSPNAITALGASLDLTLAGSATIPSGARSGLDAYNSISFTGTGTLTHTQGTQIRAYSNLTAGWAFNGTDTGTITHLAGLRALFPDNTGSAVTVTNNYALLLNDQTANTGTVTYTNRWGVYQEGASDLNYMAANLLLGSATNSGEKLQVTGNVRITGGLLEFFGGSTYPQLSRNGTSGGLIINTSGNVSSAVSLLSIRNNSGSDYITVLGGGNVGINTNTPDGRLHVFNGSAGTVTANANGDDLVVENSTTGGLSILTPDINTGYIIFGSPSDNEGAIIRYNQSGALMTIGTELVGGQLTFRTDNGSERMRISSAGLVGIGTTNALTLLHINGADPILLVKDTETSAPLADARLRLAESGAGGTLGEYWDIHHTGTSLAFTRSDYGEVARFTTTGELLIGTTSDAGDFKLQVNGNVYAAGSITTGAPTTGTAAPWKFGSRVAAAVALDATQYIEVEVGGVFYKLAIVT
jgi:hypothetical protein